MQCYDLSLNSPAENLALDEALLLDLEKTRGESVLRFWESPSYFVVLGLSNRYQAETLTPNCQEDQIPILRRCTGGGTVVQGPGCLNYSLVLNIADYGDPLSSIKTTNHHIMSEQQKALAPLVPGVEVKGHTDLCVGGIKFSGNAQRRLKHAILFHGTILYNFDLGLIEKYLDMPSKQPDYRGQRAHRDFVMNLGVEANQVKEAIAGHWGGG